MSTTTVSNWSVIWSQNRSWSDRKGDFVFALALTLSKGSFSKLESSGFSKSSKSIIILKNKCVNSSKSLPIRDCKTSMRTRAYIRFSVVFVPLSMSDPTHFTYDVLYNIINNDVLMKNLSLSLSAYAKTPCCRQMIT
jgi:hypothetical protein